MINKNKWGGKRKGAGHPTGLYPLRLIKIACTEEELKTILSLDTRARTEALLKGKRDD